MKKRKKNHFYLFKDEKASEGGKCIIALHIRKIKGIKIFALMELNSRTWRLTVKKKKKKRNDVLWLH